MNPNETANTLTPQLISDIRACIQGWSNGTPPDHNKINEVTSFLSQYEHGQTQRLQKVG